MFANFSQRLFQSHSPYRAVANEVPGQASSSNATAALREAASQLMQTFGGDADQLVAYIETQASTRICLIGLPGFSATAWLKRPPLDGRCCMVLPYRQFNGRPIHLMYLHRRPGAQDTISIQQKTPDDLTAYRLLATLSRPLHVGADGTLPLAEMSDELATMKLLAERTTALARAAEASANALTPVQTGSGAFYSQCVSHALALLAWMEERKRQDATHAHLFEQTDDARVALEFENAWGCRPADLEVWFTDDGMFDYATAKAVLRMLFPQPAKALPEPCQAAAPMPTHSVPTHDLINLDGRIR